MSAADDSGLAEAAFPEHCPFPIEQRNNLVRHQYLSMPCVPRTSSVLRPADRWAEKDNCRPRPGENVALQNLTPDVCRTFALRLCRAGGNPVNR